MSAARVEFPSLAYFSSSCLIDNLDHCLLCLTVPLFCVIFFVATFSLLLPGFLYFSRSPKTQITGGKSRNIDKT